MHLGMKAATPELMKFKRLQRRLRVSIATLVGHLELLWISTAKNAPEGDIGRFSNEDIAIACCWDGDPDEFVFALIECGWIDDDNDYRLLIHDWSEHAPTYVHGFLKRHGRSFKIPAKQPAKEATKQPAKQPAIATSPGQPPSLPNLTLPIPNQAKIRGSTADADPPLAFSEVLNCWNKSMHQNSHATAKRDAAFRVRSKDSIWAGSWKVAIARAAASEFCQGVNERGWRADIDWFLKSDSVTKLIEGKYDDRPSSKKTNPGLNGVLK